MFVPSRLTLARSLRGVSKRELSAQTGISSSDLSRFESEKRVPNSDALTLIASALRFPIGFFAGPDTEMPSTDSIAFRALTRMKAAQRDQCRAYAVLSVELMEYIGTRYRLPKSQVPYFDGETDGPESAAAKVREDWGLGIAPVPELIPLLEARGVRVLSMGRVERTMDAFSFWDGAVPYVVVNTHATPERLRFNVGHELGHLVMHRHAPAQGRKAEDEANEFSAHFLMPPEDFKAVVPKDPSIEELLIVKKRWGVSLAATTVHAHRLDHLINWRYRSHSIEIRRMYGREEPDPGTPETSLFLRKVLQDMWRRGQTSSDIARALMCDVEDIDRLTFQMLYAS